MSTSEDILKELKEELESKKKQRLGVLDQLALVDTEIDKYTSIITNMDGASLPYFNTINTSITAVKTAYDNRINANCRSKLKWDKVDERTQIVYSGAGDGASFSNVTIYTYECKLNENQYDFVGYHGMKVYQRPINRDYGATIIGEFDGTISAGSSILGVTNGAIPSAIQVNDTITDSLTSPSVFTTGDLPEVVGFGSTSLVGFVTTLVGGISTGSNIFSHFGAGSLTGVTTGMLFSYTGGLTTDTVLTYPTTIVGFGTTTQEFQYYDSTGILTTGYLQTNSLILSSSAVNGVEEGEFTVGIITNYPAIFLSTSALANAENETFTALRINSDIDAGFDYKANPNEPLTISNMGSASAGYGGSAYYTESGDPSTTRTYNPSSTYLDPVKDKIVNPEPAVGAGRADYYIGNTQWPTKITAVQTVGPFGITTSYVSSYAKQGDRVVTSIPLGSPGSAVGYAATGPGGVDPNGSTCQALSQAITTATGTKDTTISQNKPSAEGLVNNSAALREKRDEKQLYAWSLLQAAASLREQIAKLEEQISSIENFDFSPYE